ncbi:MAG TPA: DUF177 domain-containing protein [Nitrospira sp.]|nr:DUF177 domain-containing protein [Nitrospira sp.]
MATGVTMELLRPLIADMTPERLSLVGEVTAEELGLSEADTVIRGPLSVSLDLTKADDMIAVTGVLEGTALRQCVRCLREYDDPLAFSVRAAFARESKETKKELRPGSRSPKGLDPRKGRQAVGKTEPDIEEEEGDDRYFYQGDHVELAPMLREHVILAAPMQPLCREDCAGLCARCGRDLNEGPCQCPPEPQASAIRVIRSTK